MVTRVVAKEVARQAARGVQKNVSRAAGGMLGLSGERMTKVDTAWLRMDSEANLMMIVGVWTLKPGIRHEDLCVRVEERLLKYGRFRQRVVEDAAGATWVEDRKFDIANHVGFSEASTFHRAFKQWTGVAPGEYRLVHGPAEDRSAVR